MGMFDSISGFLGGEDSSSSSSSSYISPDQLPFLQNLWSGGQGLMNQQNSNNSNFGRNMFGNAENLYNQGQGFLNQLNGPYQQSQSATQQIGSLQQQLGQQSDRLMHGVGQQGIGAGQFGSSRGDIGQAMVGEGAQNALAQGAGQIMGQDQGIQTQGALGGLNSLQGMFGLGQSPYMSQWMPYMMQQGLVGSPAMEGQSSGQSSQSGGIGGLVDTAAGVGSLYAMGAFAASDRRLKTNIRQLGITAGGHNWYEYDYIWGGGKQQGVMAQEVPHAAFDMGNGYLAVDYAKVT
jgi:hypothetical protein